MNTLSYEQMVNYTIEEDKREQERTPLHPRVERFYQKWGRDYQTKMEEDNGNTRKT